jgi:hypothetical protein
MQTCTALRRSTPLIRRFVAQKFSTALGECGQINTARLRLPSAGGLVPHLKYHY